MTSQYINELSAAKNVNERAAAYAGEVIRLQSVNADLLAALESVLTGDGANCLAYGTDTPAMRRRFAEINRIASEAIRKAKGE